MSKSLEGRSKFSQEIRRSGVKAVGVLALFASSFAGAQPFAGIGRPATPAEVRAWDIDVRADFKGLPKGSGSVKKGEAVWEAQCASCHGVFGESNEVFTPIVGGTTKKDVETGRVAALLPGANTPQRTTMMKLSSLSTLWDYINRAMPWTAPKTLTTEEVYAVTAYILNLADVVPDDFVLSDTNMAAVQAKLPNRNGKVHNHAMWPTLGNGGQLKALQQKPDAQGSACMSNCKAAPMLASFLPEHARNAHGNLAEQQRELGATRGANTALPSKSQMQRGPLEDAGGIAASAKFPGGQGNALAVSVASVSNEKTSKIAVDSASAAIVSIAKPPASDAGKLTLKDVQATLSQHACAACHGVDQKLVGPAFKAIADKYASKTDGAAYLAAKSKSGGQGVWGQIPMPAQTISEADAARVAQWLMQGAAK